MYGEEGNSAMFSPNLVTKNLSNPETAIYFPWFIRPKLSIFM